MKQQRRQLTLFISGIESGTIETIRQIYNPVQYGLIKAHVTLCREDEIEPVEKVIEQLASLHYGPVTIDFGKPVRFSDGKGVLIPGTGMNLSFRQLREKILQRSAPEPRKHEPHITLMHPRNSTCTDELFAQIQKIKFPDKIVFSKISLIEQEPEKKWTIVKEFELSSPALQ